MWLKSFYKTSKENVIFDTDTSFADDSFELEKYYNRITIHIYDVDEDDFSGDFEEEDLNLVAIIEAILFNYDLIEEDGEDVIDVADSIEADVYSNIYELKNSKYFDEDDIYIGDICSLERFYIAPKYRRRGVGKYLMENLCDIIKYHSNIEVGYIVTFIKPMDYTDEKWVDVKNSKDMKKIMVDFYKKNGFKRIRKSNYFVYKN